MAFSNDFIGPPTQAQSLVRGHIDGLLSLEGDYNKSSIQPLISTPEREVRRKRSSMFAGKSNTMWFPEDLSAHAMVFQFERSDFMSKRKKGPRKRIVKQISLPVPANLIDSINAMYNDENLGMLGGALSDMQSFGAFADAAKGAAKEAFNMGQNIAQGAQGLEKSKDQIGLATAALTDVFRKIGGAPAQVGLARFLGSVPNPHLTALFQGIGLRSHSFSWRLSPSNVYESHLLHNIINTFKGAMLPNRTNQNLTLEFPDEVCIYIRGHMKGLHMYEFKRAVIKNVTTNFAPDNIPSFFAGTGAPTHVDFKLDFLETTIHTRDDYDYYNEDNHISRSPSTGLGKIIGGRESSNPNNKPRAAYGSIKESTGQQGAIDPGQAFPLGGTDSRFR